MQQLVSYSTLYMEIILRNNSELETPERVLRLNLYRA